MVQRAGEAVYTPEGRQELSAQVSYYMENARIIREGLEGAGFTVYGGIDAPYIGMKTPEKMGSWEFFAYLLEKANVVGRPGEWFGACGEGYFRLTTFGDREKTKQAIERIRQI